MNPLKRRLRKYFVMGSQDCLREPEIVLEEALKAGVTTFQYREKGPDSLNGREELELGGRLQKICKDHDALFIVNDKVELAEALDADGIHVGQDDLPVEEVRRRFPDKIIGLSVSRMEEVRKSRIDLVDYVGAGPIYETGTKPGEEPTGINFIDEIKKYNSTLPIVAIGGIKPNNAKNVLQHGADGLAVVTAITRAEKVDQVVTKL